MRRKLTGRTVVRRVNPLRRQLVRREINRGRATNRRAQARQQRSASARRDVFDQRRLGRQAANHDKFSQSLLLGPLAICYNCSSYT